MSIIPARHLRVKYSKAVWMKEKLQRAFQALTATHTSALIEQWEAEYRKPMPMQETKPLIDRFQCNFNDISKRIYFLS